jgi:NAD-dependent dihydropyrimidine dehydrogenase PreA subunit
MASNPGMLELLSEHWHLARQLRRLEIKLEYEKCVGTYQCYEVCPVGCWTPDMPQRKVILHDIQMCIACGACVLQCPEDAIRLD